METKLPRIRTTRSSGGVGRHAFASQLSPRFSPRISPRTSTACVLASPASPQLKWAGKSPHSAGVAVLSVVGSNNGVSKSYNQDAFLVEHVPLQHSQHQHHHPNDASPAAAVAPPAATLIGVFDGHGRNGHHVSSLLAATMREHIASALRQAAAASAPGLSAAGGQGSLWWEPSYAPLYTNLSSPAALAAEAVDLTASSAQSCLELTFSRAAESVAAASSSLVTHSGSTAVLCLVLPDSVVAAWAGDSRAVVGKAQGGTYIAMQLTQDHKPNRLSEMARIVAAGGKVSRPHPSGPFRVCLPGYSDAAALSVARAFGDLHLAHIGVVPTPEFAVFPRSSASGPSSPPAAAGAARAAPSSSPSPSGQQAPIELLLVATDGLWEVVDNQEAVEMAAAAGSPEEGAELLVELAQRRWAERYAHRHSDDCTVAVAWL